MKTPEFLGPYRIADTLGKGGMGTVFRAQHVKSGKDVAVKLIATQISDEMRFRRRFDAEIETLKRLSHPNIVRLIGYGEEQGMLFYSMEFVQGETLQTMIRKQKRLAWKITLDIAIQVCSALKHAHDLGVIHRDLKPANLIIQHDGQVKLVDFGISKIFGFDQTAAGSIMGTADYMAPEQATEAGTTVRTDLYSLGVVIYAMLCGRPPFRGKDVTAVIDAVKNKPPVPLDMIDPEMPDDIVQIVSELLEKEPGDRPPTALAVMNRLKAMRAGLEHMQTVTGDRRSDDSPSDQETGVGPKTEPAVGPDSGNAQDDTLRVSDRDAQKTLVVEADPKAKTVSTDDKARSGGTIAATGLTNPLVQSTAEQSSPTEVAESAKTHFQTVSDGSTREGFFWTPETVSDHQTARIVSIGVLVIALITCTVFLYRGLRKPTADELLARMESLEVGQQRYEIENERERFLKLFPDHPRAAEIRDQQMIDQVNAAIRRLRLKAKLRVDESPLVESTFLDAMDLRGTDTAKAEEKLRQWLTLFAPDSDDPSANGEDRAAKLAKLVAFEADRLAAINEAGVGASLDPQLVELMKRIDEAEQLADPKKQKQLKAIITLYDGQDWATPALQRAREALNASADTPK